MHTLPRSYHPLQENEQKKEKRLLCCCCSQCATLVRAMFSWVLWFNVGGVNVTWLVYLTLAPGSESKTPQVTKSTRMEKSGKSCENRRRSVWNCLPLHCVCASDLRSFVLLHLLVGFQFVPVAVLYSAVQRILTADHTINQPFPRSFALWLCWDFIDFINVLLGEAFSICAKPFLADDCRCLWVYLQ